MNAATHYRFGYVVQISSLLTLALVNIALPNWIGAVEFARLNEAYAFIGFSCIVFNEGAALLVIRAISRVGDDPRRSRDIALQGAFEHVLLTLPALAAVIVLTSLLAPQHHYRIADWAFVALNGFLVALYVVSIAWLTARLQNRVVAMLAVTQGLLSFLLPLAALAQGLDVRWAIAGSHVVGVVACGLWMRRANRSAWRPAFARSSLVCLVPALPAACAQTAMRLTVIWLPVLVLAAERDAGAAAAYKIGISLALGVCAMVPFHKQTMLSLNRHTIAHDTMRLAAGAVIIATGGALLLNVLAVPLTAALYKREFGAIASYLPAFGVFVVLQVTTDVLLVQLMSAHSDRALMFSCGMAILASCVALSFVTLPWVPVLTLATFVVASQFATGTMGQSWLLLRATIVGVVAAGVAAIAQAGVGLAAAVFAGALAFDKELRQALLAVVAQVLGRARK